MVGDGGLEQISWAVMEPDRAIRENASSVEEAAAQLGLLADEAGKLGGTMTFSHGIPRTRLAPLPSPPSGGR